MTHYSFARNSSSTTDVGRAGACRIASVEGAVVAAFEDEDVDDVASAVTGPTHGERSKKPSGCRENPTWSQGDTGQSSRRT